MDTQRSAVAPGRRTRMQAQLRAMPTRSSRQRHLAPGAEAVQTKWSDATRQWMPTAMRPDLCPAPVQYHATNGVTPESMVRGAQGHQRGDAPIQMKFAIAAGKSKGTFKGAGTGATKQLMSSLDAEYPDRWARGWKKYIQDLAHKDASLRTFNTLDDLLAELDAKFPAKQKDKIERPNFSSDVQPNAKYIESALGDEDTTTSKLKEEKRAVPHTISYYDIKTNVLKCVGGTLELESLEGACTIFLKATALKKQEALDGDNSDRLPKDFAKSMDKNAKNLRVAFKDFAKSMESKNPPDEKDKVVIELIKRWNSCQGNLTCTGPQDVNASVSKRTHLGFVEVGDKARLSLGSKKLTELPEEFETSGVATTESGNSYVSKDGKAIPKTLLTPDSKNKLSGKKTSKTKLESPNLGK